MGTFGAGSSQKPQPQAGALRPQRGLSPTPNSQGSRSPRDTGDLGESPFCGAGPGALATPNPQAALHPRACSVRQWVWAPPLSLHHPRQQLSTPGRVGREHPAGSIPSSGEGSLLARTQHAPVLRCLLPWAPSSGGSVWGRRWGGQRAQPGNHQSLDSWVPPSPRPETPAVELALDEAICEIFWKVPLPQKSLSTHVVSRGLRGEAGVRQGSLCVWGSDCQGSRLPR